MYPSEEGCMKKTEEKGSVINSDEFEKSRNYARDEESGNEKN